MSFAVPITFANGWRIGAALASTVLFAGTALAAPYVPDARTPAEIAVAGALDVVGGRPTGPYVPITGAIDALPNADARAEALGQLSTRNYRLLPRMAIQSLDATDRALRGYLVQRREMAFDASPSVPQRGDRTLNMMVSYGLKQAKFKGRPDRPVANSDSRSILAAVDVTPMRGLIAGITMGIDGIDTNLDRSQRPRSTLFNASFGGYASYTDGRFYVDATAAYAKTDYKVRRQVAFSGFSDQLTSKPHGDNGAATVEAGMILQRGAIRAEPFGGLQYRYADLSGFAEQDVDAPGGPAALGVARFRTQAVRSSLGTRLTASTGSGRWTLRPSIEAQWQRELRARPDSRIEAVFLSGGTPIFTLPRSRVLARDAGLVSAGLTAVHGERTALRLSYTGEFSSDRRVHMFGVSLNRRLP